MRLLLERGEAVSGWCRRRLYRLTATLVVDAPTAALIARHELGRVLVWVSPAALAIADEAEGLIDRAAEQSLWRWQGIMSSLALNLRGLGRWRAAGHEPSLSVDDLLSGATLESWSVAELSAVEAGLRAGLDALAGHIRAVEDYDEGDDDVLAPQSGDAGKPASGWARRPGRL